MDGYALPELLKNLDTIIGAAQAGNIHLSHECKSRFERAVITAYQKRNTNDVIYTAMLVHFGRPWSYWKCTREISEFLIQMTIFMEQAKI